jgi:hypothetical protein
MMSCPICKRQETYCLECLSGELWPSTLNCRFRMGRRKVRAFAKARPLYERDPVWLAAFEAAQVTLPSSATVLH